MKTIISTRPNGSRRLQVSFEKPSRTKQAFKDECDVNNILKKYQKNHLITHVNSIQGSYGDFTNATDYQEALNSVMLANERFQGLPAHIRQQFNNDPASFIDFISDDQNYDKALQLGLLDKQKAETYLSQKAAKTASKAEPNPQPTPKSKTPPNDD